MKIPVAHQSVEPCSSIALRRTVVGTMDHGAPMPACLVLLFVRSPSVHESSTSCYLTVDMDLELPIALCLWTQQALPLAARTMHMIIADPYEPYQPSKSGSFFFEKKHKRVCDLPSQHSQQADDDKSWSHGHGINISPVLSCCAGRFGI